MLVDHILCSNISSNLAPVALDARNGLKALAETLSAAEDRIALHEQEKRKTVKDASCKVKKVRSICDDLVKAIRTKGQQIIDAITHQQETDLQTLNISLQSCAQGSWERTAHNKLILRLIDSPDTVLLAMAKNLEHRVKDLDMGQDVPKRSKKIVHVDEEALTTMKTKLVESVLKIVPKIQVEVS